MSLSINNFHKSINKFLISSKLELLNNLKSYILENFNNNSINETTLSDIFDKYKNEKISLFDNKNKKKETKRTRKPSQYNLYIGQKMREIKELNKDINSKELMKLAIQAWVLEKKNKI